MHFVGSSSQVNDDSWHNRLSVDFSSNQVDFFPKKQIALALNERSIAMVTNESSIVRVATSGYFPEVQDDCSLLLYLTTKHVCF